MIPLFLTLRFLRNITYSPFFQVLHMVLGKFPKNPAPKLENRGESFYTEYVTREYRVIDDSLYFQEGR